jgi:hypothetical protein
MNESQKALGELIAFINRHAHFNTKDEIAPSLTVIKNLVDRDVPKNYEYDGKNHLGSVIQCPNCYWLWTSGNFCKHCGQRLKGDE